MPGRSPKSLFSQISSIKLKIRISIKSNGELGIKITKKGKGISAKNGIDSDEEVVKSGNLGGSPSNVGTSGETVSGSRGANGQIPDDKKPPLFLYPGTNTQNTRDEYDNEKVRSLEQTIKGRTPDGRDTNRSLEGEIPSNINRHYFADPPGIADERTLANNLKSHFMLFAYGSRQMGKAVFSSELLGIQYLNFIKSLLNKSGNSRVRRYAYSTWIVGVNPQGRAVTAIYRYDSIYKTLEPLPLEGGILQCIHDEIQQQYRG